jgi:CubicO group peptidase (beta-lactamase class C family)
VVLEGGELRCDGDPDDVVPWWSFGKTVLAAAALSLVANGRLCLDEPVDGAGFTLRQLLQHTSGLPDYGGVAAYHRDVVAGAKPWSRETILERSNAAQLLFQAGGGWEYSSIGYMRAAELVAQAARAPLGRALASLVFRPLGVGSARLATRPQDLTRVSMGAAVSYHPGWVYHGLIVGTLADAARLLDALLAGRLLPTELLAEMRRVHPLPQFADNLFSEPAYGLGLMRPRAGVFGHTGGGPGSSVAVYRFERDPGARTVAAFATSENPRDIEAPALELGLAS